jgi:hypothetical protein
MKYLKIITHTAFLLCLTWGGVGQASDLPRWYETLSPEWGGHFRIQGEASRPEDNTLYGLAGTGTCLDGSGELRIKNRLFPAEGIVWETHYEMVMTGGDTRRKSIQVLDKMGGTEISPGLLGVMTLEDDQRLMDLTKILDQNDTRVLYHRLDRFSLSLHQPWGMIRLGRQALTWGNGLAFNPMDLFNPFAPSDILRDYKIGDDMAMTQFSADGIGEFQFLYLPRRNIQNGDVEWKYSALAGKLHFTEGTAEFDLAAGKNYENSVLGLGGTGYIGDAAWRADLVWTLLPPESHRNGYGAFVVNIDYSWVWKEKNFYGYLELYHNGLGKDDCSKALSDPVLIQAIARGEMFTLGKTYLAGMIQAEVHPLFNIYVTMINNMDDFSGMAQPRCVWSLGEDLEAILGANLYYGGSDTEYGGFDIPGTDRIAAPANGIYAWVTYYF